MERQSEGKTTFPPFAQKLIDRGELKGLRETLLRLVARAGISLTDDDRDRIRACDDTATLNRWIDNILAAKTADDVFS